MRRFSVLAIAALTLSGCNAEPAAPVESAGLAPSASPAAAPVSKTPDRSTVERIVAGLMEQHYGSQRDDEAGCTPYVWQDADVQIRYCMQAAAPEIVPAGTSHDLYLRTFNLPDAKASDAYDAITPGLMGAFRVRVEPDGQWRVLDAARAMAFGTMGACGCEQAEFARLGPQRYGWMFTSGGTWQGITVTSHEIVAPRGGGFADLSAIPEIREDAQDTTYSIRVVEGQGEQVMWPLEVSKKVSGRALESRLVSVDPGTGIYRLPDGF